MPRYYLNHFWVVIHWTLRSKLQWNLNHNAKLLVHENASPNIVSEMHAILSRRRWVKFSLTRMCCLQYGHHFLQASCVPYDMGNSSRCLSPRKHVTWLTASLSRVIFIIVITHTREDRNLGGQESRHNTSWLELNGLYFAENDFKCISLSKTLWIPQMKVHWNTWMFLRVWLIITQYWFR